MTDLELELRVGAPAGRTLHVDAPQRPAGERAQTATTATTATTTATFPYDLFELDNRLKDLQIVLPGRVGTRWRLLSEHEHERAVMGVGREIVPFVET